MLVDVTIEVAIRILVPIKKFLGTGAICRDEFDGRSVAQRSDGRCSTQGECRGPKGSLAG